MCSCSTHCKGACRLPACLTACTLPACPATWPPHAHRPLPSTPRSLHTLLSLPHRPLPPTPRSLHTLLSLPPVPPSPPPPFHTPVTAPPPVPPSPPSLPTPSASSHPLLSHLTPLPLQVLQGGPIPAGRSPHGPGGGAAARDRQLPGSAGSQPARGGRQGRAGCQTGRAGEATSADPPTHPRQTSAVSIGPWGRCGRNLWH